ncbi:hypothetical protein MMC28_000935 [Mycoblastus sanguinarius]|nr:hypothetical protein [Mycoblastus sanguinarius]
MSEPKWTSTDVDGAPLGPWLINGFKWFSSATDANMTILIAKTPEGGISAFYAPMRRKFPSEKRDGTASLDLTTGLNGITIQRLKSKLGTRPVPTAELSLNNTRAYLLGAPGQGVREISTVLNITRVHNALTAVGLWGRGLAISRAFARVRSVRGKLLAKVPAHVRTMAKGHVEYRASMLLTFFIVALLGVSEQPDSRSPSGARDPPDSLVPKDHRVALLLLRVLTPTLKAMTTKSAIAGLAECMESLGGVGYLDSCSPLDIGTNIARLYRDANVLSIWEGTTDVMADDTIRVLKGKGSKEVLAALEEWVEAVIGRWRTDMEGMWEAYSDVVWRRWRTRVAEIRDKGTEELSVRGRETMHWLNWVFSAVLLVEDARRDGDKVSEEVARRWVFSRKEREALSAEGWEKGLEWDRRIVFGHVSDEKIKTTTVKL